MKTRETPVLDNNASKRHIIIIVIFEKNYHFRLFLAAKYDWCLFLGHLVLEKALKAAYVLDHENEFPPKTHNLVRLIQSTSIPVDEDMLFWLDQVNDFHVEARYPDYKY